MMTSKELADLLMSAPVKDISARSGVSVKTIYRLRHEKNSPTLATVQALLNAIKGSKSKRTAKAA
jgi:transcriptional regulator with XRE-family HTH domain